MERNEAVGLLLRVSKRLTVAKHYTPSIRSLEQALKIVPNHPESLRLLSIVHEEAGDMTSAYSVADKLVEAEPNSANSWLQRGNISFASGNIKDGQKDYLKVLEIVPGQLKVSLRLAELEDEAGRPGEAALIMWPTMRTYSKSLAARSALADYLARAGFVRDAIVLRFDVLESHPENLANITALLKTLLEADRSKQALEILAAYEDKKGQVPQLRSLLSAVDNASYETLDSVERITGAYNESSGDLALLRKLISKLIDSKLPEQAQDVINNHINVFGETVDALLVRADVYENDSVIQLQNLERAFVLAPQSKAIAYRLSALQERNRKFPEAAETLNALATEHPDDKELQYRLGLAERRVADRKLNAKVVDETGYKHLDAAERAFRRGIEIDSDHVGANRLLTTTVRAQGRFEEAKELFERTASVIRKTLPSSFAKGLAEVERKVGVTPTDPERLSKGFLPDRSGWSAETRFRWGRLASEFINTWIYYNRDNVSGLFEFVDGPDWEDIAKQSPEGAGGVLVSAHIGAGYLQLASLSESSLPSLIVGRTDEVLLSFGDICIDARASDNHTALAKLSRRVGREKAFVFTAGDGGIGRAPRRFEMFGQSVRVNIGPAALAYVSKAPVYFFICIFGPDRLEVLVERGPSCPKGASLDDWYEIWFDFFARGYEKTLSYGPENMNRSIWTEYQKSELAA